MRKRGGRSIPSAPVGTLAAVRAAALIRACVEKIVLQNGKVEIYYAIEGASGYGTVAQDSCFLLWPFMPLIMRGNPALPAGQQRAAGIPQPSGYRL